MEVLRVVVLSVDPPLEAEEEPDPPPTSFLLPLSFERTQEMMTTSHSEPWKTYKNTMLICLFQNATYTQCSKIGKKVQFQKCKKTLFSFSKITKNQFLPLKKSENCIFGSFKLFSSAKIVFLPIFEMAKNVFLYF